LIGKNNVEMEAPKMAPDIKLAVKVRNGDSKELVSAF
jgi:hypothetical protein